MATRTYLIFGDVEGKLDTLRVECTKCRRRGRYSVRKLIEKYGRKANMMKWKEQLNGDCPKRDAHSMHERCDLICRDLPKVFMNFWSYVCAANSTALSKLGSNRTSPM